MFAMFSSIYHLHVLDEYGLAGELLLADVTDDHGHVVYFLVLGEVTRVTEGLVADLTLVERQRAVVPHVTLVTGKILGLILRR